MNRCFDDHVIIAEKFKFKSDSTLNMTRIKRETAMKTLLPGSEDVPLIAWIYS